MRSLVCAVIGDLDCVVVRVRFDLEETRELQSVSNREASCQRPINDSVVVLAESSVVMVIMAYEPCNSVIVVDKDVRCTQIVVDKCRGGHGARLVGNRGIMMVDSIWDSGYDTHEIPQGHAFLDGKFLRLLANDSHRFLVQLVRQEPVSSDCWIYIDTAS